MNLYYHMYSGERLASLGALISNIAALRQRQFIGVTTSRFAASGAGFYLTSIEQLGPSAWRVRDRGGIATLRFARGDARMVDSAASTGVLGERVINGDLYVALDPADPAPVIALAPRRDTPPQRPMLIDSGWEVSALTIEGPIFRFAAQGLGEGQLDWRMPQRGRWRARAGTWEATVEVGLSHILALRPPALAVAGLSVTVQPA